MEFTGERFMPEVTGRIEIEHLHRYFMAKEYAKDKIALDIASGEGYGTAMLAEIANYVYGVDISAEAVAYAREKYSKIKNVEFLEGNCAAIPLPDDSVDFVCSFETIEHHDHHCEMMQEVVRVLKPDGVFMISSPDKFVYSDSVKYKNPFHVKELYKHEFETLIRSYFDNVVFHCQKVLYGSIVGGLSEDTFLHFQMEDGQRIKSQLAGAPYLLALASKSELPLPCSGVLETSISNSDEVEQWGKQVELLNDRIAALDKELDRSRRGPFRRLLRSLKKRMKILGI